jgi:hypothetical protein
MGDPEVIEGILLKRIVDPAHPLSLFAFCDWNPAMHSHHDELPLPQS